MGLVNVLDPFVKCRQFETLTLLLEKNPKTCTQLSRTTTPPILLHWWIACHPCFHFKVFIGNCNWSKFMLKSLLYINVLEVQTEVAWTETKLSDAACTTVSLRIPTYMYMYPVQKIWEIIWVTYICTCNICNYLQTSTYIYNIRPDTHSIFSDPNEAQSTWMSKADPFSRLLKLWLCIKLAGTTRSKCTQTMKLRLWRLQTSLLL